MKRITTIICCVAMMILGVATAFQNFSLPGNSIAMAQPAPIYTLAKADLPLDLQLDLDKRHSRENFNIKDSINIIDSVRWVTKTRWKTRYKSDADRTTAREAGTHPMAVNPDSIKKSPAIISTVDREENATEIVGISKIPSIQLSVDGHVVYSSNDSHSAGEGR